MLTIANKSIATKNIIRSKIKNGVAIKLLLLSIY